MNPASKARRSRSSSVLVLSDSKKPGFQNWNPGFLFIIAKLHFLLSGQQQNSLLDFFREIITGTFAGIKNVRDDTF